MKWLVHSLFVLWCVLFFLFIGVIGYYFYDVQRETKITEKLSDQHLKQENIHNKKEILNSHFVLEGNIKHSIKDYAITHYYALPEAIRTAFEQSEWKLVLTDKDIQKEYYEGEVEGHLSGLTSSKEQKIYIHSSRTDIRNAFIHEFGHFFDFISGIPSTTIEFQEIYVLEKNYLKDKWKFDDHCISNAQEYFAEAFAQMIVYPEIIENSMPKTYEYINTLLNES